MLALLLFLLASRAVEWENRETERLQARTSTSSCSAELWFACAGCTIYVNNLPPFSFITNSSYHLISLEKGLNFIAARGAFRLSLRSSGGSVLDSG